MQQETLSTILYLKKVETPKSLKKRISKRVKDMKKQKGTDLNVIGIRNISERKIKIYLETTKRSHSFITVVDSMSELPIVMVSKEILIKKLMGKDYRINGIDCVFINGGGIVSMIIENSKKHII